ncbi:hypothetical protein DET59_106269 [Rossellomorea aquimaris]|uniref:Uncharacterized protein n=1 Tax=Rossellomorea aquimaris TaxID=189382 RepID=A0A366EPZ3_9BACI|nr:hypothetical protein DET59_106269 [Rossellomorea aquimaris]
MLSHASLAVLGVVAVVDASVAEAAEDAAEVADVAAAADVDAADVNRILEYGFQMDPCVSSCRGLYFILHVYIRDKLRLIRW